MPSVQSPSIPQASPVHQPPPTPQTPPVFAPGVHRVSTSIQTPALAQTPTPTLASDPTPTQTPVHTPTPTVPPDTTPTQNPVPMKTPPQISTQLPTRTPEPTQTHESVSKTPSKIPIKKTDPVTSAPSSVSPAQGIPQLSPVDTPRPIQDTKNNIVKDSKNKDPLSNKIFPEDLVSTWRRTKCLNCGYVHEGETEMIRCPRCGNSDPDKFGESE